MLTEIVQAWREMPQTMLRVGLVQLMSFLGLFCMWLYFGPAVAHNIFHSDSPDSAAYRAGIEWSGLCQGGYNLVCFVFAFALPGLARAMGRKYTHTICLLCGAVGADGGAVDPHEVGAALEHGGGGDCVGEHSLYAVRDLAAVLPPNRIGVYMGIFNFFVVVPEIVSALVFGYVVRHWFHNDRMVAVASGGVCMLIAAVLMQRVKDPQTLSIADI